MDYVKALEIADTVVSRAGFDVARVPHPIAVVYLVGQLDFEVASGGVVQWLTNRSGRHASKTVEVLREIGADNCANIVERMVAPLGAAFTLEDDSARVATVQRLATSEGVIWRLLADELLAWPDDVDALLRRYVEAHAAAFVEAIHRLAEE